MRSIGNEFRSSAVAVLCTLSLLAACSSTPEKQGREFMRHAQDAEASYRAGQLDSAKTKYRALLIANPKYTTAHIRLGAIAHGQGDFESARSEFKLAARIDPAKQPGEIQPGHAESQRGRGTAG